MMRDDGNRVILLHHEIVRALVVAADGGEAGLIAVGHADIWLVDEADGGNVVAVGRGDGVLVDGLHDRIIVLSSLFSVAQLCQEMERVPAGYGRRKS